MVTTPYHCHNETKAEDNICIISRHAADQLNGLHQSNFDNYQWNSLHILPRLVLNTGCLETSVWAYHSFSTDIFEKMLILCIVYWLTDIILHYQCNNIGKHKAYLNNIQYLFYEQFIWLKLTKLKSKYKDAQAEIIIIVLLNTYSCLRIIEN